MTPEPMQAAPVQVPLRRPRWFHRIASLLLIIFCLELGLFLLIYPWTDSWSGNFFSFSSRTAWHEFWNKGYLRGAVSGLGLVNIWVAVAEALRMYIGAPSDDQRVSKS